MIYVITGYMRTGTSMWMGGISQYIEPAYDPRREDMNVNYGDKYYKPNGGGFFELAYPEYMKKGFPLWHEGKLIKIMRGGLYLLSPHEYKMVFMLRDPEEIRQSYEAFFETGADISILGNYEKIMGESIKAMEDREDVDLSVFQYREVVENPTKHCQILKDKGWPIDVEKVASFINPELYRFRLENLVVGL